MDFDQLVTFMEVAKLGSFSRAGQKVFRSQSAVSAQIRQLEQEYGDRLLDRSGKPLPVEIPLAEDPATHAAIVEMSLSGLGHGDFLIELTAGAGSVVERRLLAFRLK